MCYVFFQMLESTLNQREGSLLQCGLTGDSDVFTVLKVKA